MSRLLIGAAVAAAVLAQGAFAANAANPPGVIIRDSIQKTTYDGVTDDLLSAGLNLAGLIGSAPTPDDPLNPTEAELRQLAIYTNYRGIVDPVPGGGMGVFWGPQSRDAPEPGTFDPSVQHGLIPGVEYLAYARVRGTRTTVNNVTIAVQIPENFDLDKRCILVAPPSGSRGVYGGIGVGEWGLFNGCAVVLPGKGTGTGFHDLDSDTVYDIKGNAVDADEIGDDAHFAVKDTPQLRDFQASHPHRIATKAAHDGTHPEIDWGAMALNGIEFAFWALNDHFDALKGEIPRFNKRTTLVIASGISNGGGASVRALEADAKGLIDGLVVTEPSLNPDSASLFDIQFGDDVFSDHGATLYDDITVMGTYAACAINDPSLAGTPFFGSEPLGAPPGASANRCTSLAEKGLVSGDTLEEQSASAIQKLREVGYYEEMDWGIAFHEVLNLWRSLQPTYAGSYGRFDVWDNICDVSFAATNAAGDPVPVSEATLATLFGTSSGIPATAGINLIADNSLGGPILEQLATSPSTMRQDLNLDGALCFRYLSTGDESLLPDPETGDDRQARRRVAVGSRQIRTSGDLQGVPAIIAYGRQDALVFPNSHSRAYYGLNQVVQGDSSELRIWEVTPGQHFDAFLSNFILDPATGETLFVPLHFYLTEGLDMMLDHLMNGDPLPPSQVIRAEPRGLTEYTLADFDTRLPLPDLNPGDDAIVFDDSTNTLIIPE